MTAIDRAEVDAILARTAALYDDVATLAALGAIEEALDELPDVAEEIAACIGTMDAPTHTDWGGQRVVLVSDAAAIARRWAGAR